MKVELTSPCSVPQSEFVPNNKGSYCNVCNRQVVDYSNMGDQEYYNHIQKHGLGCGQYREDQLSREIEKQKKKKRILLYIPVIALFFAKPLTAKSQLKQDTVQHPGADSGYKKQEIPERTTIEEVSVVSYRSAKKRFGGGYVCSVPKKAKTPAKRFWFNLFRKKTAR